MRRLHLAIGPLALAGFLATGQYMDARHDHLRGMAAAPRLLFRSAHICLLFASLLNLTLGLYVVSEVSAPEHVKRGKNSSKRAISMKVTRNLGMLLLGVWLILTGLSSLLGLSFSGLGALMGLLALAAGVAIVAGR